jgi:hypothetical protein
MRRKVQQHILQQLATPAAPGKTAVVGVQVSRLLLTTLLLLLLLLRQDIINVCSDPCKRPHQDDNLTRAAWQVLVVPRWQMASHLLLLLLLLLRPHMRLCVSSSCCRLSAGVHGTNRLLLLQAAGHASQRRPCQPQ